MKFDYLLAININLRVPTKINLCINIVIFYKHDFETIAGILGLIKQNLVTKSNQFIVFVQNCEHINIIRNIRKRET